jgi:ABC-type antimicrobial peptide transport system permease subunit
VALVLKHGIGIAITGLVVGLTAAFGLSRYLLPFLYGVTTHDAFSFVGVGAFLVAVAACACYLPARRATKVDPLVALRCE